jgi:O-antigen/teichoic acid export membrane protein
MIEQMKQEDNTQTEKKANSSFKWNFVGQLFGKLITPLTNMLLSRLLAPEIFGIVASVTIVVSFADILSEGGFAKYILQHNFKSENELDVCASTAEIASISISLLLFVFICIFNTTFASLVNADGYGSLLMVSAISLPLYGAGSVFTSLLQKNFKFKSIAFIKIVITIVQSLISVLLGFLGLGLWSMPVGTVSAALIQIVLLFVVSGHKFLVGFSISVFASMVKSTALFLLEALFTWVNSSADVFFISSFFPKSDAGIYKNAFSTTIGLVSIVSGIYSSVLISLLSTMQNDDESFRNELFKYQRLFAYLFVPLSLGILCFKTPISLLFFGDGWGGAEYVVGYIGFAYCIKMATGDFSIIAFTAKGKPLFSVIADGAYSIAIIVCALVFCRMGFYDYVVARSVCVFVPAIVSLCFSQFVFHQPVFMFLRSLFLPTVYGIMMYLLGLCLLTLSSNLYIDICFILICLIFYLVLFWIYDRDSFIQLLDLIKGKEANVRNKFSIQ